MFNKLIFIGLLGLGLVATASPEANAQISGWGWFGFSSIHGTINTAHTPPPQTKPSAVSATVNATIQIACKNPANNGISNGNAFQKSLTGFTPVDVGNITDRKSGKASTEVNLNLEIFEDPANCTNPNWTPVKDSAMALAFSGDVTWCLIDDSGALDCSRKGFLDKDGVTCTLDTTLPQNQRLSDGRAPGSAEFGCNLPQ